MKSTHALLIVAAMTAFLLAFGAGLFPLKLQAQPGSNASSQDMQYQVLAEQKNEMETKIQNWKRNAAIIAWLGITVAGFGFLSALLQMTDRGWSKAAVAIMGGLVTLIVLSSQKVFHNIDDRTLLKSAAQAETHLNKTKRLLPLVQTKQGKDRDEIVIQIQSELDAISRIEESIYSDREKQARATEIFPTAIAASPSSGLPDWTQKAPSDNANTYFVGKGRDKSLSVAKELALNNAINEAGSYLIDEFKKNNPEERKQTINREALSDVAKKSLEVVDTAVVASETGPYDFYVLTRIKRYISSPGYLSGFLLKVVHEFSVDENHKKTLGGIFAGDLSVAVGDIEGVRPFTLMVFLTNKATRGFDDANYVSMGVVKNLVPKERRVFDDKFDPGKPEISFRFNNVNYKMIGKVVPSSHGNQRLTAQIILE